MKITLLFLSCTAIVLYSFAIYYYTVLLYYTTVVYTILYYSTNTTAIDTTAIALNSDILSNITYTLFLVLHSGLINYIPSITARVYPPN